MQRSTSDARAPRRGVLHRLFRQPLDDLQDALDSQVVRAERPLAALFVFVLALVAAWWIYVPVHELLHAIGCRVTGGAVSRLEIAPEYGGALLAHVFPFVVSGGDYAGRLSGFDTHGSDLVYLATDAAPFLLSIVLGVPLLRACNRGRRSVRFGAAVVLALAPFYSLTGDYYEMGSILVTRAATLAHGGGPLRFAPLRSDDVIRLVTRLWTQPHDLQLDNPGGVVTGLVIIGLSLLLGTILAFVTYWIGTLIRVGPGGAEKGGLPLSSRHVPSAAP
jgi:hypothetical protein